MKFSLKNKKLIFAYILYLALLTFVLLFAYKFFERNLKLQLNVLISKAKYFVALKTRHTSEKEQWLKKWNEVQDAWYNINYMVHVPYLMFQYRPNIRTPYLNTNDMGFRGKENYSHLPSVKPEENYRYVILLGGSSAFGALSTSDDKCISAQLEKMLNENYKKGKRFKVINLSTGFYNSFQELIAYILYGLKFNPEVVITFDGFNDATVSASCHEGKRIPLVTGNYNYTKEVLDKINDLYLKTKARSSFTIQSDDTVSWEKESKDFVNDVAELYRRNLDLICLISQQNNTRVILTLQPIQTSKDGHLKWKDARDDLEQIYQLMPNKIREVTNKYNVEYINFHEIFSKNEEYNDYFSHTDSVHLIDKGQEIVAEYMLKKIRTIIPDEEKD